ncbi:MAG: helix-turn-helix transcriptional regulator [Pseudomonadota bacterium]|nr:helix-turn-helix transcriptional regulator [Pseudomonadota bacterium]
MVGLAERLRRFDAEEGDLIARFYAGVGTAQFFQDFMAQLAEVMALRSGSIGISNLQTREIKGGWPWNIEPLYLAVYVAGDLAHKDRLLQHVMQSPVGRFYSIEAHLPDAADYQARSEVYQTWANPQGIRDVAMGLLLRDGDWVGFVVLHRRDEQGPFLEPELAVLDRLLPHLQRGLELHRGLVDARDQQHSIDRWLSLLQPPALLFDEKFEMTHLNSAARQFLEQQGGIRIQDGRFDLGDPQENSRVGFQVMAAVKLALGQYELEPEILRIERPPHPPFTLVFLPLRDRGTQTVTSAAALVFIYAEEGSVGVDLSPLQPIFGLTAAEQGLCDALVQGQTLAELAQQQNKSKETLRTQLRRIFRKVGVSTQTELVVTLMTHPALLAPPSPL